MIKDSISVQRKLEREEIERRVPRVKIDAEKRAWLRARRKLLHEQAAYLLAQEEIEKKRGRLRLVRSKKDEGVSRRKQ